MSLCGSTIVRADDECKKKFSFRVWNSQTLQCFYFSAVDEQDYTSWFNEVVKEAEQVTPSGSFEAIVYYYPKERSGSQGHMTSGSNDMDVIQLPPGERKQVLVDIPINAHLVLLFQVLYIMAY